MLLMDAGTILLITERFREGVLRYLLTGNRRQESETPFPAEEMWQKDPLMYS